MCSLKNTSGFNTLKFPFLTHPQISCSTWKIFKCAGEIGGLLITLLLVFLWLYLPVPRNLGFKCVGGKCDCVEELQVIDCSIAGLKAMPQAKKLRMPNYTMLLLKSVEFYLIK